ncbi:IclR family transcriptional regulator [Paenibacillus tarimensis]
MDRKYWVPALDKAARILELIAQHPHQFKLIDLSKKLGINKSSMFSLLLTMEELRWITRDKGDTYALSSFFGMIGSSYFRQFDLISLFHREAPASMRRIGETIQLAKLEGNQVLYLAKEEALSPVRLASDPGMRLPAHQTALGKAMLAGLNEQQLAAIYPDERLPEGTPHTVTTRTELIKQLKSVRREGIAYDLQEAVVGFSCLAAPVYDTQGVIIAAVSCSMPQHEWEVKRGHAYEEIGRLAGRLSQGGAPATEAAVNEGS